MLLFMSSLFIFFASWLSFRDCFFDREGRALWRKREVRCKLSSCFLSSGNTELWKWSAGFIWWFYFGLLLHVVPVLFTFSQCSPCILGCSNSSKSTSNEIRCSRRKSMPFGTLLGPKYCNIPSSSTRSRSVNRKWSKPWWSFVFYV